MDTFPRPLRKDWMTLYVSATTRQRERQVRCLPLTEAVTVHGPWSFGAFLKGATQRIHIRRTRRMGKRWLPILIPWIA